LRSPVEGFEHQYKVAAAEGAIVELKIRLLADKVPELQKYAHDNTLGAIETLIGTHFSDVLTEEEKTTLALCRQLRNKILHCDFRAARQKLEELGITTERGGVKKIDIAGLSATAIIGKIAIVKANAPGTFQNVGELASEAGTVFAWLIEVGVAGDFVRAAECFARAAAIVDRLAIIR
jgi:hypothetical protein